jgi:hypothetical protein
MFFIGKRLSTDPVLTCVVFLSSLTP